MDVAYERIPSGNLPRMNSLQHSTWTHTLLQVWCVLVVCGMICSHSEPVLSEDRYLPSNDNARAAIEELNDMLRYLFPIVPRKSHFVWSSKHQGYLFQGPGSIISGAPQQLIKAQLAQSNYQSQQEKIDQYEEEEEEEDSRPGSAVSEHGRDVQQNQQHMKHVLEPNNSNSRLQPVLQPGWSTHRQAESNVAVAERPTNKAGHVDLVEPKNHISNEVLPKVHLTSNTGNTQLQNKIYRFVLHKLQAKPQPNRPNAVKSQNKANESSPATLGKRGPECMRRCILQGLLHPVQCHSLC